MTQLSKVAFPRVLIAYSSRTVKARAKDWGWPGGPGHVRNDGRVRGGAVGENGRQLSGHAGRAGDDRPCRDSGRSCQCQTESKTKEP
jgi:hypothetical protein